MTIYVMRLVLLPSRKSNGFLVYLGGYTDDPEKFTFSTHQNPKYADKLFRHQALKFGMMIREARQVRGATDVCAIPYEKAQDEHDIEQIAKKLR